MKCRLALFAKALIGKGPALVLMPSLDNKVPGFPVTVAVDRNSTLIFSRAGRISPAELTASAEAVLK